MAREAYDLAVLEEEPADGLESNEVVRSQDHRLVIATRCFIILKSKKCVRSKRGNERLIYLLEALQTLPDVDEDERGHLRRLTCLILQVHQEVLIDKRM